MQALPLFHRVAGMPVIVLGEGPAAEAKRRLAERAGAEVVTSLQEGIDRGARLAFVARDDAAAAEADAVRLRCAGLLVNVVDRPDLCDFTTPSVLDRDPVLVAIGTGGASAGLAKHLRLRLEAIVPEGIGALAGALAAARSAIRARFPAAEDRRRALDQALGEGGPLDPLGQPDAAEVARWIAGADAPAGPERIEIRVDGDPGNLTLRQAQLLGRADRILVGPGVSDAVLDRARADAERCALEADDGQQRPGLTLVLVAAGRN